MKENMNWHTYFMSLVYLTAMKSKDESTKIGAVIIDSENSIISTGFNGICRNVKDDSGNFNAVYQDFSDRLSRPEKYFWFEHAERNAIYNAARNGHPLNNSTMYTQGIPCADCARGIIQSGIKNVYVHETWEFQSRKKDLQKKWEESSQRSKQMFKEARVSLKALDIDIIKSLQSSMSGETSNI